MEYRKIELFAGPNAKMNREVKIVSLFSEEKEELFDFLNKQYLSESLNSEVVALKIEKYNKQML